MCKRWRDGGLWEAIIQTKIGRKIIVFGVVAFRFKFNQRTTSTPHKFKAHAPSQKSILFRPRKEK